jgi:hypothetical protein
MIGMDSRKRWIVAKVRLGWALLLAGVVAGALGAVLMKLYAHGPYNYGILTGLGILLVAVGIELLVRYRRALSDDRAASRLVATERDERTVLIRSRAGNRAYWVSAVLIYAGLMWASFAANGGLPMLAGDTLWYFLAAAVLLPFFVYVGSMLIDERAL